MIKYGDLVQYIKDNHVNWNTDLFDVLRGFFELKSQQYSQQFPISSGFIPVQQELLFKESEFHEPKDGEYSTQDLLNLFNT